MFAYRDIRLSYRLLNSNDQKQDQGLEDSLLH